MFHSFRSPWPGAGFWLVPAGVSLLLGCGSRAIQGTPMPSGAAAAVAQEALAVTRPSGPSRILFDFHVREADLRFNGRGLARMEPPYRVRLDLFGHRGETLFQAALVEGVLRIPEWAPRELAPPPSLLWAALGIFRPDPGAELLGGERLPEGAVVLRYEGRDGMELRFRFSDGRLRRAELLRDGHLDEEVDLSLDDSSGRVLETVYRNQSLFLEMLFSLDTVEDVESFAPDIWYPGR
ncbi:MAG: hypothetical protein ACQET1_07960 [Gemmatimonadota bacterium]